MIDLPKSVRVEVGRTPATSRVLDGETGQALKHVVGLHLELDARVNETTRLVLVLEPELIVIEGHPTYELQETALKHLCARFGYELKKIPPKR